MNTVVRWNLALAALVAVAAMALLSFTPLAWRLEGSPDTSYPEIIFMTIGLPSSLVALAAGVMAALQRRPRLRLTFVTVCLLELLVCVLLASTLFLPDAVLSGLPEGTISLLLFAWPVLLAVLIAGGVTGLLTAKPAAARAGD